MTPVSEGVPSKPRRKTPTPKICQDEMNEAAFRYVCGRLGFDGNDPRQVTALIKRIHFLDSLYQMTSHSRLVMAGAIVLAGLAALWSGISAALDSAK